MNIKELETCSLNIISILNNLSMDINATTYEINLSSEELTTISEAIRFALVYQLERDKDKSKSTFESRNKQAISMLKYMYTKLWRPYLIDNFIEEIDNIIKEHESKTPTIAI